MGGKGSSAPSSPFEQGFQQWLSQYRAPAGQQTSQQRSRSSDSGGGGESSFPSAPQSSKDRPKQPPTMQPVIILTDNPTPGDRARAAMKPGIGWLFGPGGTLGQMGYNAYTAKGRENVGGGTGPGFPVRSAKPTLPGTPSTSRGGKSLLSDDDDDEDSVFGSGGSDYGMAGIT